MLKRSVTRSLARTLFAIVLLSVLSSTLALLTLSASLRDAEAINIAGSLRMQSYRLAWDAAADSAGLAHNIDLYQQTVEAPVLHALERAWVPDSVKARYHALQLSWRELRPLLLSGNTASYQQNVSRYVTQIDRFVLALQHWAELKMKLVASACLLGFVAIALLVLWTLRRVKKEVVIPLHQLVTTSQQIEQANFHYAPLETTLPNELGVLAQAFTHMSEALEKQYIWLEQAVKEKTRDLLQANRRLALLYQCSEMLRGRNSHAYSNVLHRVREHENLHAIALVAQPQWQIQMGEPCADLTWQTLPLDLASDKHVAELRWQAQESEPPLMQGLATMLARSLQLENAEQSMRHLLLMEERATIARELHDSLAQSLVYLRIQMVRLKRAMGESSPPAQAITGEIDRALTEANRQLRELLNTFRLSVEPADLLTALRQVIAPLQNEAKILLEGEQTLHLSAAQQVHVLQIVREALLNAIRHASATQIIVRCMPDTTPNLTVEIEDNGPGLKKPEARPGHYGLAIMQERARSLHGTLKISQSAAGGTKVAFVFPLSAEDFA